MARVMKVMIVDDEMDMRQSVSQWLALSGYDTETYASAEEALSHLSLDYAGIVVTDIRMPKMDGMTFFEENHGDGFNVACNFGHRAWRCATSGRGDAFGCL